MPTYLLAGTYSAEGAKGLLKDGGSKRRKVVQELAEKAGGRLVNFYFAFGKADVYCIVELPDQPTAAALSLAVGATGAVQLRTTVLLTAEELDAASKKSVGYRPPGA